MTIKSAGNDESHIRPGEVQVALPASADASLYFIGRIRTPWKARKDCPKNARVSRESGVVCTIEVDPRWQQALPGVETCSHLIVLYWMDRARRDLAVQVPAQYGDGQADLFAPLAGAAQSDRAGRGRAPQGRGQHAPRRRCGLPRQHPAARHQALFLLHRRHPRRPRRLARGSEGVNGRSLTAVIAGPRRRFTPGHGVEGRASPFEPFSGVPRPMVRLHPPDQRRFHHQLIAALSFGDVGMTPAPGGRRHLIVSGTGMPLLR